MIYLDFDANSVGFAQKLNNYGATIVKVKEIPDSKKNMTEEGSQQN